MAHASFLLHVALTLTALLDNDPRAHEHKHSSYLAYLHLPHAQELSAVDRSKSALSEMLGAIEDHPAVAHMGWDVIMYGASLVTWAATRGLDLGGIARAAGITNSPKSNAAIEASSYVKSKIKDATVSAEDDVRSSKPRRHPKSSSKAKDADKDDDGDGAYAQSSAEGAVAAGEEEFPEDLEAGALSCALLFAAGLGAAAAGVLGAEIEK